MIFQYTFIIISYSFLVASRNNIRIIDSGVS